MKPLHMIVAVFALSFASACATAPATAQSEPSQSEHFFPSRGVQMHGRLYAPAGEAPHHTVLYVHGGGDYSLLTDPYAQNTARAFVERGMAVFVFDKRGLGQSGGEYEDSNLAGKTEDVRAALDFLRSRPNVDHGCVIVWAISQAGWFAPQAIEGRDDVCGLILVSPAGVSPIDHIEIFARNDFRRAGITGSAQDEAAALWSAILRYQGSAENYEAVRAALARAERTPWLAGAAVTGIWQGMPARAADLLTPDALRQAWEASPADYAWPRERAHYEDFSDEYAAVRQPVLLVYGSIDTLIDPVASRAIFERVWAGRNDVVVSNFIGAGHGIQTRASGAENPTPPYLDQMTNWARARFGMD